MKLILGIIFVAVFGLFLQKERDISGFLNKKKQSKELSQYMASLGKAPDEVYKSTDSYYESYYNKGISFNFDYQDRLVAVFVYSNLADDYKAYQEKLPKGLDLNLTRKEIETKFGTPDYQGEASSKKTSWVIYRSKGFGVTYNGLPADSSAKIKEITFQLYN